MKKLKRFLALFLVLSMMLSVVPFGAFASESTDQTGETSESVDAPESGDAAPADEADAQSDDADANAGISTVDTETGDIGHMATKPADGTSSNEPFPENTGGSYSFRIPAMVTLSDGTVVAAADARWNTTYDGGGLDTIVARSSDNGATWNYTFANYLGDNGNVYSGSSTCFIDPSLAVTADDTIYMLCDLYPYGVALNGNKETTPVATVGFFDDNKLKLSSDSHANYDYYLNLTDYKIYSYNGDTKVTGYTVDEYFNIKSTDGTVDTNLFFSDSPYKVVRTGFLYLTKSTDKGATWSAPELLNLKTSSEMVCLVGPNGGMVTSEGVIVFPVYSYTGSAEYTGLIYSEDNGASWKRSANLNSIDSSEADAVELGNGKLRVFFRNETTYLCYADYDLQNDSWSSFVNTQVFANSNTELSAITYSKGVTHNGVEKDVILVSCPASANLAGSSSSDGSWRTSGRIFAGLVDPDTYEMTWLDASVAVTPVASAQLSGSNYTAANGFFAYSSITELSDGSVAILYEDNQFGWGAGSSYGYTMAYNTYTETELETALGVTFIDDTDIDVDGSEGGDTDTDTDTGTTANTVDVNLKVGETATKTIAGVALTGSNTDTSIATVTWTGTEAATTYATATLGTDNNYTGDTINVADCLYTFTASGNGFVVQSKSDNTLYLNATQNSAGYPNSTTSTTVTVSEGYLTGSFYLLNETTGGSTNQNSYLHFYRNGNNCFDRVGTTTGFQEACSFYLYRAATATDTSSEEITGYVRVTDVTEGEYLIAAVYNGSYYLLHPSTSTSSKYAHVAKVTGNTATDGTATTASTTVTIKGNAVGNTKVTVGTTTYNITVTSDSVANVVDVELMVGDTVTKTIEGTALTGSNADDAASAAIAAVTWTGTSITSAKGTLMSDSTTAVDLADCLYTFTSTGTDYTYYISATLADGTTVYVEPYSTSVGSGCPNVEGDADTLAVQVLAGLSGNQVKLYGNNGSLHFHAEATSPYWNRCGTDTTGNCNVLLLYRPVKAGETPSTEIPGYVQISRDEIVSGGQYLIAAQSDAGNTYVLHPVSSTDKNAHMAKVDSTNTTTTSSTAVTITGVSAGTTVAVVGNTQYNITVKSSAVNVELEVGESLTYTDTTGNYVGSDTIVQPDSTYATMTVADGYALQEVTALESGKQYLIVNKANGTVLTDTEMNVTGDWGNKPGLATTGTASANSTELWTVTVTDSGDYYVVQNGQYLTVAGFEAGMSETATPLTLTHTNDGWVIYDYTTGPALGHAEAGYYLTDNAGNNYVNGALGTSDTTNAYRYWTIYEIKPLYTDITFTGVKEGTTTATVGGTTYNITVEAYVLDDEIHGDTIGYTVDAELQRNRYNELIKNVAKDLYTDESWPQYEEARKAAFAKLNEVDGNTYATEAEAQEAIAELKAAIDALEAAKAKLVAAETITIHYQLNGTTILTEEYKVAADATTLTLPDVIVVDKQTYTISADQSSDDEQITITDGVLTLPENDTVVYVDVEEGVTLGNGLVASGDISADDDYVGTGAQIADLVKDDGTAMKITEMTLTTGFSYDLDLADTLADGQTVTWSSSNEDVATVDENGIVTAVAEGTATITATVKDADGNIVSVNSIPVTVFTSATTDRVSAVYIEEIENTTVYCVVNADTDAKAFEVIEGELIYGKFDTTVSDGTATTAFSFFGDPDEAHALVAMTSTNSFGDYYLLHDEQGNLGIGTEYYRLPDNTTGAGYWQAIGLTDNNHDGYADWTKIEAMINWAIKNGCDGGMGFTRRQSEGNIGTNLTFISDPMPTIEKEVYGVLPTSRKTSDFRLYTDGMVAAVNELVYFKITVTLEEPMIWSETNANKGAITYTDAIVEDTILKGAYLYTKDLDQADGVYDGEIDEAYRVQTQDITDQLNAAWTDEEKAAGKRTLELYLLYEIQESDIPKFYIDNIAYLNYDYQSEYSTGAQAGAADAEARISVVGTSIDDVVIDFGQSFVYEGHEYTSITDGQSYTFEGLTNTHLKGAYVDGTYNADGTYVDGENDIDGITASKATAKYGTVKVTRTATGELDDKGYPEYTYTVTYTPTQILQGVDTVLIYGYGDNNQEKIINGFMVYPATTVYYEEGFILNEDSTWSSDGSAKATANQTFELLGASQFNENGELTRKISNKKHAYGFDPIYDGEGTDVAKSSVTSTTLGDSTTFTFTGNGFELFADCTTTSGRVSVQVKNSDGEIVKFFTVNTVVAEEIITDGDSTDGQNTNMYSLPIVSWHSETHDTYTVTVRKVMNTDPVIIDGVRIFNTLDESKYATEDGAANSPFTIDLEDAPEFYQLRNYVLSALNVTKAITEDYKDVVLDEYGGLILERLTEQVYGEISTDTEAPTAVILADGDYDEDVQNLLDNGPKNEIYLHKDETLVFNISTNRMMQIGLKAPEGSAVYSMEYTVNGTTTHVATEAALNTTVDMFYELGNSALEDAAVYTITITNKGDKLLSITDLKICDDPNAAFVALTEEDIATALTVMGYSSTSAAQNTTTGAYYDTVADALSAAAAGETIALLADCTGGNTMITDGVTLDLNGFNLTASYAVTFGTANVIDSVGTGSLIIGENKLVLQESNAMVPVYNGEAYVFTKAGFSIKQDSAYTGDGIKINTLAYPVNMDVVELLKDGGSDNNIEIIIRLSWDTDEGTGSQEFKFTDAVVGSVYSSNGGTWSSYSKMFTMIITGFESITNLKATVVVVSGTGVEYESSTGLDIT